MTAKQLSRDIIVDDESDYNSNNGDKLKQPERHYDYESKLEKHEYSLEANV